MQDEPPRIVDAVQTRASLPFQILIPALREAYAGPSDIPLRHHHFIPQPDGSTATVLIMPAWRREFLGVKLVTIFPNNGQRNLPGLYSSYLLCDGETGQHLALIDGNEITARRTIAVSALGASYLAREDASRLLVVGAGRIAKLAAEAFSAVRPIRDIAIWNINAPKAESLAAQWQELGYPARAVNDLETAVGEADIVSCATLATEPLIKGAWLKPGAHLDLIGSFTPFMREADDDVFRRGRVWLDTRDALKECGELLDPINRGVLSENDIVGTLADLTRGECKARESGGQITVFKAAGNALSDIASAALVFRDNMADRLA